MPDEAKLYISVESSAGHLVVDGPMALWVKLLDSMRVLPPDVELPETDSNGRELTAGEARR